MPVTIIVGLVLSSLVGCASKSDIEKTLTENPDIIFNIIEKNPEKFADAAGKAQMAARRVAQSRSDDEMKTQMELEFKSPKSPQLPPGRAFSGDKDATITLVEYSDFQCPYCRQGYLTVRELEKRYGKKLRLVFKHLPLPFHPLAMPAAKRFEAIALQSFEKAFKFHNEVFENQSRLTSEGEKFLDSCARRAGADLARMKRDMEGTEVKNRIDSDMTEARNFGMSGTPGFLVNGVSVRGAYPSSYFEPIIDRHLASSASRQVGSQK